MSTINLSISGRPQVLSFVYSDPTLGTNFGGASVVYSIRIGVSTASSWYVNRYITNVFGGMSGSANVIFSEYI